MDFKNLLFRKKQPHSNKHSVNLRKCLTAFDLTMMGIGAVIGAGIFVLTGIAAATKAGPAIMLSYLLAGLACAFSALSYAELASSIGGCGSAYSYAYAGLGEFFAWLIGWDLLLEYGLSTSAVAVGWSSYVADLCRAIGFPLPELLRKSPLEHGLINLPAAFIVFLIMVVLAIGVKQSARFNSLMVLVKLSVLALFVIVAMLHFNAANWHPFMPFGWHGVVSGAGLIFFAYIGFDAISTTAEEAINPQRDLPIGIIASLVICTLIYILVSGLLTASLPYTQLNVSSPVAYALLELGHQTIAGFLAIGAIAGITTVILVMYYGLTRIFFAMARDGLLPNFFASIHPKTQTPVRIIISTGILMTLIAGFVPIYSLAELVNIGTLAAFVVVCVGVIVLRYTHPLLVRPFKTPFAPLFPILGILLCVYLMCSLSGATWLRFLVWCILGLIVYFAYSRFRSSLARLPSES